MTIDIDEIQDAVLQIFADLDVPAGGHLSLDVLRTEWPRMRLRRGDMVKGVRELLYAGLLELDEDIDGPLLILTTSGYNRVQEHAGATRSFWNWLGIRKTTPDSAREPALATAELPPLGRRHGDH